MDRKVGECMKYMQGGFFFSFRQKLPVSPIWMYVTAFFMQRYPDFVHKNV